MYTINVYDYYTGELDEIESNQDLFNSIEEAVKHLKSFDFNFQDPNDKTMFIKAFPGIDMYEPIELIKIELVNN